MPTRREFLGASSAAIAGTILAPSASPASSAPFQGAPVPPSIQALTSQKSRARPITVEERQGRIERARALLTAEKLDALFLTGGIWIKPAEWAAKRVPDGQLASKASRPEEGWSGVRK